MIIARGSWSVRSVIRNSSSQELSSSSAVEPQTLIVGLTPLASINPGPEPDKQGEYESNMNLDRHAHTEKEKKKMRGERKAR